MNIVVLGAGAVGCYLGAVLSNQHNVTLIGREKLVNEFNQNKRLQLTDYEGRNSDFCELTVTDQPDSLADADLILLTVKCLSVHEAAHQIQAFAADTTPVLCLQNGIGSDDMLRHLNNPIIRGTVGFNVAPMGRGLFHRGTEGDVRAEASLPQHIADSLNLAFLSMGFPFSTTRDFEALQWAKLQLNLNNAINALSDKPLKQELETLGYRRVLSMAMSELMAIVRQERLRLPKLTKLPPSWIPLSLRIPDSWFRKVASSMLAIDPQARSSMWEDLNNQRMTEIDYLNGAVVRAGRDVGIPTPVNRVLVRLIKEIESGRRQPGLSSEELLHEIRHPTY
ncbi:2-dehydropantoate 2-reductase [Thalassolituus sp.]|uniref:2-dehydropantoate 2-reductase n=1 Tax=Thalassolituus sp. TaxID=2030822 RepID=UPI003510E31B